MMDSVDRSSERGGTGVKFAIALCVILLVAHAGYNYVPVAYNAESFKTDMQTAVVQGLATPGKLDPVATVKAKIQRAIQVNDIPPEALVDVKQAGNSMTAHVTYSRQVNILPFGIFRYNYVFDHTATPTGFLLKE
jgi:hypothetical protein